MTNPLLAPWDGPHGLPRFELIEDADFAPAYEAALAEARANYAAIAANPAAPDFDNTLAAMERAEATLGRVGGVFWNLVSAESTEAREALERDLAPKLAAFSDEVTMNPALWQRLKGVPRDGLTEAQLRLHDLYLRRFRRAGAELSEAVRKRMAEINERLSVLTTEFGQRVLAEEKEWVMPLAPADLEGLPESLVAALTEAGHERGLEGPALALTRSLAVPFLEASPRRDLREKLDRAYAARGANENAHATEALIVEILKLRAEKAGLFGKASYADWALESEMAGTPSAARGLLENVFPRALVKAREDEGALQKRLQADGHNGPLETWDWRYYAEAQRREVHDLDDSEVRQYFPLDAMIGAAFDVATRLFGLSFAPLDAPLYHPDARAWSVSRAGKPVGVFIGDYFARPNKRGGAWMNEFRAQHRMDGGQLPIIVNVCNFNKADPTLLSFDDARTLFHEFGHALHGLLTDVPYPTLGMGSVATDWVELPSQIYEHWFEAPEMLAAHARHWKTGAPIPEALRDKLLAANKHGKGFETVGYTAAALTDMTLHSEPPTEHPLARQKEILAGLGMPAAIRPFHSVTHFRHLFSGDMYAAGYYSYMWSEVLDADAFDAFTEAGDIFDRATAERFEREVLAAGASRPADELYQRFRGRMPGVEPLLKGRGLI